MWRRPLLVTCCLVPILCETMTQNEAKIKSETFTVDGLSGWRVPKINEISRMFSVYKDREVHPFVNVRNGDYCTSEKYKENYKENGWPYVYRFFEGSFVGPEVYFIGHECILWLVR